METVYRGFNIMKIGIDTYECEYFKTNEDLITYDLINYNKIARRLYIMLKFIKSFNTELELVFIKKYIDKLKSKTFTDKYIKSVRNVFQIIHLDWKEVTNEWFIV